MQPKFGKCLLIFRSTQHHKWFYIHLAVTFSATCFDR